MSRRLSLKVTKFHSTSFRSFRAMEESSGNWGGGGGGGGKHRPDMVNSNEISCPLPGVTIRYCVNSNF